MIIGSSIEWPIGSLQKGINEHTEMPFVVLGHATREEWLAQHVEETGHPLSPLSLELISDITHYYLVSVD